MEKTVLPVVLSLNFLVPEGTLKVLVPVGDFPSLLLIESYAVTPKPGEMPDFRGAQNAAEAAGTEQGKQEALFKDMGASLPRLEQVVSQLSELGKTATYTKTGQAYNAARRELGMQPPDSAIARKEYISKVDNEVLPLLRQTFGAQFTQREGESLKLTMGDPDASPSEKEAVLRSFIDSKRAQIDSMRSRLGKSPTGTSTFKVPSGSKKFKDNKTGKIVFSTDGKTYFDAETGQRID